MAENAFQANASGAGLHSTAKEHEDNLVIDRSFDRLIRWIGVYLFTLLAVIVKLVEITVGEVKVSERKPEPDNADKMYVAAILEQWCINSGFESTKYLKAYMIKQIVTAVLASFFSVAIFLLIGFMSSDMLSSDLFGCQLPYEDVCMLCSIQQTRDIFAVFVCNAACTFAIAILSITNWLLVRRMRCRNTLSPEARYFEKLEKVTGAVSKLMLSLQTTTQPPQQITKQTIIQDSVAKAQSLNP